MNKDKLMDVAIKKANEEADAVKKRTKSFAQADAAKVKKVTELTTGYIEAMITVSWQKDGFEETRSNLASSIQIIEKLGEDTVAEISKSRDYKITGAAVKQFYGRLNSILSKVNFRKLEELTG